MDVEYQYNQILTHLPTQVVNMSYISKLDMTLSLLLQVNLHFISRLYVFLIAVNLFVFVTETRRVEGFILSMVLFWMSSQLFPFSLIQD